MAAIAGLIDTRFFEWLTHAAAGVAMWASVKAQKADDPLADLTERLRHPVRWAVKHPVQALLRLAK